MLNKVSFIIAKFQKELLKSLPNKAPAVEAATENCVSTYLGPNAVKAAMSMLSQAPLIHTNM